MKRLSIFLLLSVLCCHAFSSGDTLRTRPTDEKKFVRDQIFAAGLITGSLILNTGEMKNRFQDLLPDTHTRVDDYLQHGPSGMLVAFDLAGVKHRSSCFVQAKNFLVARAATAFVVSVVKQTTSFSRPSGGSHTFPSAHTATAFVGASLLYNEFRDSAPLLAYSGFAVATATACLRMTNDAHWLPDVMAGAGIGILVTNLVYQAAPLKRIPDWKGKPHVTIAPTVSANGFGLVARW